MLSLLWFCWCFTALVPKDTYLFDIILLCIVSNPFPQWNSRVVTHTGKHQQALWFTFWWNERAREENETSVHGGGAAARRRGGGGGGGGVRPPSSGAHCCSLLLEAAFLVVYQTEEERMKIETGHFQRRPAQRERSGGRHWKPSDWLAAWRKRTLLTMMMMMMIATKRLLVNFAQVDLCFNHQTLS